MPATRAFAQARTRAVSRAFSFLERLSLRRGGLNAFGSGLLYCCGFLAATTPDPALKLRARQLNLTAFNDWCRTNADALHDSTPVSLCAAVQTLDAMARAGRHYPRLQRHLQQAAAPFTPTDFHGFDPRIEAPPANLPDSCDCGSPNSRGARRCIDCGARLQFMPPLRAWYMCFINAYCGQRYGVPLGLNFADTLHWLPHLRHYTSPKRNWVRFHDSVYAITHLVYTLNDYGRYLLDPAWLSVEYDFLCRHWAAPIEANDPDMTGEFLDSLRAFGLTESDPAIRYAMEYLIESQNSDGSWGARQGSIDYRRFHATWAALDGLREFKWTKIGLSFPELLPVIKAWSHP